MRRFKSEAHQLVLLFVISLGFLSGPSFALPFINEFHYDNAGSDVGEFVEVAGAAGTDLSGWSLSFYNGTNGAPYASWDLSGILTDQSNGFGTFAVTGSSTIQNGDSDGIALIDNLGQVVQFLSYEGQLTASNGAATGQMSTDIGIAESSSTNTGYSLQRTGFGLNSEDFSWEIAISSFGLINEDQQFLAPIASSPIVSSPIDTESQVAHSVPEPSSFGLLLFSLCVLVFRNHPQKFSRHLFSRYSGGFSI